MNPITLLIVDDEKPARRAVRALLKSDPEIEIIGEAADGERALELIREQRPQLLFLDIQMPLLGGMELLSRLRAEDRPEVVFVTAHDVFALNAFELYAVDYLLKPFSDERFADAVRRAKQRIRSQSLAETTRTLQALLAHFQQPAPPAAPAPAPRPAAADDRARLVVKADGQLHFLNQRDIRWIEGQGDFVKIHLKERGILVRLTMTAVEKLVQTGMFVRIHKSAIINLAYVRRVVPMLARSHGMELDDGHRLPIGRNYREVLKQFK